MTIFTFCNIVPSYNIDGIDIDVNSWRETQTY